MVEVEVEVEIEDIEGPNRLIKLISFQHVFQRSNTSSTNLKANESKKMKMLCDENKTEIIQDNSTTIFLQPIFAKFTALALRKIIACLKYKQRICAFRNEIKIPPLGTPMVCSHLGESIDLDDIMYYERKRRTGCFGRKHKILTDVEKIKIGFLKIQKYDVDFEYHRNRIFKRVFRLSVIDNIKKKHYIRKGEECPICYDPIFTKMNAFITKCSHCFHYKCIQNHYDINFNHLGECPMCRQSVGYYEEVIKFRYPYSLKGFDVLEDFWNNIDSLIPKKCYRREWSKFTHIHDLGMNEDCQFCRSYRQTGKDHRLF